MGKNIKIFIFIVVVIFCSALAFFAGKYNANNSTNPITIKNETNNSQVTKETQEVKYAYIEEIAGKLNEKSNSLHLYTDFSSCAVAYAPLMPLTKEYPYSTKTTSGEIIAVSKYVQGTYKIDDNLLIDVLIIQDKSFENGGFLYLNEKKENYVVYKYKESYLIFKYLYDIATNHDANKKTSDFIQAFYKEYSKVYVTSSNP